MKIISANKKASFNYYLFQSYEAGLQLQGSEIKSIREHNIDLRDSFAVFRSGELYIINMQIPPYSHTKSFQLDPFRRRKLLLHHQELRKIEQLVKAEKYLLIPTKLYFKNNVAKLAIALAKPKKRFDKRELIKKRESLRKINKIVKQHGSLR